jgi:hypothetical protein
MDIPQPEDPGEGLPDPKQQDLVVVDRGALRQMLTAVLNTIKAAASIQEIDASEEAEPGQVELLKANMKEAQGKLVAGIEHIADSVEKLPRVNMIRRPQGNGGPAEDGE